MDTYPVGITADDQRVAIDALNEAVANGTPVHQGDAYGPNGAMCACAVIAHALGHVSNENDGYGTRALDVYNFLERRGFSYSRIFRANDSLLAPTARRSFQNEQFDHSFKAAARVVEQHAVRVTR